MKASHQKETLLYKYLKEKYMFNQNVCKFYVITLESVLNYLIDTYILKILGAREIIQ